MTAAWASEPGNLSKPYLFGAGEKGGNLSKLDFFGAVRRAGPHKTSMFWQGGEVAGTLENLGFSEMGNLQKPTFSAGGNTAFHCIFPSRRLGRSTRRVERQGHITTCMRGCKHATDDSRGPCRHGAAFSAA